VIDSISFYRIDVIDQLQAGNQAKVGAADDTPADEQVSGNKGFSACLKCAGDA